MTIPKPEPLCRYRYDPLDRLASHLPLGQADAHSFYCLNKPTTQIQGQIRTSWLQANDRLLAQYQQDAGKNERLLIATDAPGSVIHALGADQPQAFGYTPYGTRVPAQALLHLPGFNGERRDPVTGHYLLGNGYRAFNPVLMRFNSLDSLSPFGGGGVNAYTYCVGDPVNRGDSSGHTPLLFRVLSRSLDAIKLRRPLDAGAVLKRPVQGIGESRQLARIGGKRVMIDRSSMSRLPIKQGPLTAEQTLTIQIATRNLPTYIPPQTLAERAVTAIAMEHVSVIPKNHPVYKNSSLNRLFVDGQRRSFAQRFLQAKSDQEKLILTSMALRQHPSIFRV